MVRLKTATCPLSNSWTFDRNATNGGGDPVRYLCTIPYYVNLRVNINSN